jgi:hypothetical protein
MTKPLRRGRLNRFRRWLAVHRLNNGNVTIEKGLYLAIILSEEGVNRNVTGAEKGKSSASMGHRNPLANFVVRTIWNRAAQKNWAQKQRVVCLHRGRFRPMILQFPPKRLHVCTTCIRTRPEFFAEASSWMSSLECSPAFTVHQ